MTRPPGKRGSTKYLHEELDGHPMRETLEQMAKEFWRSEFCDSPASNAVDTIEDRACALAAAFTRKLLNEARPYMCHKSLCKVTYSIEQHPVCSCGLAELLEGLK